MKSSFPMSLLKPLLEGAEVDSFAFSLDYAYFFLIEMCLLMELN